MATAKTSEEGARVTMFRAKEPSSGQEPILDEKGKQVYHVDGATVLRHEQPDGSVEEEKVTKDTPRAKPLHEPWVINPDQYFAADHWMVQKYPHLFIETDPTRPSVESR